MYSFKYGGKDAVSQSLIESLDKVVVRTQNATPLSRITNSLSSQARSVMNQLVRISSFPESGIAVMQCNKTDLSEALALRNEARTLLKKESEIRFAGRVLQDERSGAVTLYTENFFVKFFDEVLESECLQLIRGAQLQIKAKALYAPNAYYLSAPEGTGLQVFEIANTLLEKNPVQCCHPELVRERRNKSIQIHDLQWHLKPTIINGTHIKANINIEEAWEISKGENAVIAIIDDGVEIDHPEFEQKVVAPHDLVNQTDNPRPKNDMENHGTACAGVACAKGNKAAGVAPLAKLMPIRNALSLGDHREANAFYWAANNGADIISCSWGPADGYWENPGDPLHTTFAGLPDSTRLAIEYATKYGRGGRGCVVVWAAGNGNESMDFDAYASNEHVIAVAASNDRDKRSIYSDYGKAVWCCFPSDDRGSVMLNNPLPRTLGIFTTDRLGTKGYNPAFDAWGDSEGHYIATFGGTSSACPGVAGIVALLLSANPQLTWRDVKNIIKDSCTKIDAENGLYDQDGHSIYYGYGKINPLHALQLATQFHAQPAPIALPEITGNASFSNEQNQTIANNKETGNFKKEARLLGFHLSIVPPNAAGFDLKLHYQVHINGDKKLRRAKQGEYCGTQTLRKKMTALSINLEGKDAPLFDVKYKIKIKAKSEWLSAQNGQLCGSIDTKATAISGLLVELVKK